MNTSEKRRILRALNALRKQRVILKARIKRIDEILCRLRNGSREECINITVHRIFAWDCFFVQFVFEMLYDNINLLCRYRK